MLIYNKIWMKHHGPIPYDNEGRIYDIHHIDGNHNNNAINNLMAISLKDHYDIHYNQGDYAACLIMSARMKITPKEKSRLASISNKKRVENGTNLFANAEFNRQNQSRLVETGKHHWLGGEMQRNSTLKLVKDGKHPSQTIRICPHCGKEGKSPGIFRWHFNHCNYNK